ncbi:DUF1652 domain-containing protein [Pseudomonas gingeri]|uniref:DUF1652 domain-containing protein n=1 Tax=Pseudomonas gingeri TaxID=117681 RepID=A0A7Y7YBD7_9PSED|nr:DUF1652 domain-containing protein [Pseudomonas gingeri]NWA04179.1 DUF1652 domain-containing protein [Pseudomonas gingeri]NWA17525.1 DUF1652 domain-containing protein [Pseudomonas gingeri]NWA56486.1 DUF1652 domain-containing protein [Pseudomonas gingeri]NWA97796.1 DUF1652 domain-containing protein [Pseudomonas gingeri]NWB05363.1 DUF1652 domain-containing protein [Pseudomonas gingeri]
MDLRTLIERGFAPLACECVLGDASLSVRVYDRQTGRVDLMVAGIALSDLQQREDALRLIDELRDELACNTLSRSAEKPG